MDAPDLHRYLDYRSFLADWFAAKKASNPRYSHRAFVRRTGQKSPSLLADVIAGRRNLTTSTAEGFVKALGLKGSEARFFRLLVDLDQAATPTEKNAAWEGIAASRRFREARRVEGDSMRYLSTWYVPVIRELARRPDFRADAAWVAKQVRPSISTKQAEDALELLFDLDLIQRADDGGVEQSGGTVATAREVAGLAAHNYHQGMLDRAKDALHEVPSSERHYLAVTVTAPPSLVPKLKEELNALQDRILDLCAGTDAGIDPVMQFHLHFFPLSRGEG